MLDVLFDQFDDIQNELDNSATRRSLWYDILFYKRQNLPKQSKSLSDSRASVDPTVLRLLNYPIAEEIRCFLWSEFLSVRDSYVIGYYSIIRNKQYGIPTNSLSVIEADLRRMEISSAEHRQMLRLLVASRWDSLTDRRRFTSTIPRWDMSRECTSSLTSFSRFSLRKKRSSFLFV